MSGKGRGSKRKSPTSPEKDDELHDDEASSTSTPSQSQSQAKAASPTTRSTKAAKKHSVNEAKKIIKDWNEKKVEEKNNHRDVFRGIVNKFFPEPGCTLFESWNQIPNRELSACIHDLGHAYGDLYKTLSNKLPFLDKSNKSLLADKSRLEEEIRRLKEEVQSKNAYIDQSTFKKEFLRLLDGKILCPTVRRSPFFSCIDIKNEDIVKNILKADHWLPQSLFEHVFSILEKRTDDSHSQSSAESKPIHLYTNGSVHVFHNKESIEMLWSDSQFAGRAFQKVMVKRNSMAGFYRGTFGEIVVRFFW